MAEPDVVGPWAREKLAILENYLQAYCRVFKNQSWAKTVYVDAFAGSGRAKLRSYQNDSTSVELNLEIMDEEQIEYVDGSPRTALNLEPPFDRYVFVEDRPSRVRQLEELSEEIGLSERIQIVRGDCNEYLKDDFLDRLQWNQWRGVVFLDPFGMNVPWATIEEIAHTDALEIILNFPEGMAIQRLLYRDSERFDDRRRNMLDRYFGTSEWFDVVYREVPDLFGGHVEKVSQAGEVLAKWYMGRLEALFGNVAGPHLVTNTRGGRLYYMIWSGHHPKGREIADHVLMTQQRALL